MRQILKSIRVYLERRGVPALLAKQNPLQVGLTLQQRVAYERAIEKMVATEIIRTGGWRARF